MRKERVASVIVKEISNIVEHEIRDPRLGFITILNVDVSSDLKNAKVFFSCIGDKSQSLQTLTRAKGFIRSALAQRLRMRCVPDLQFELEDSYERGMEIDELFEEISSDNKEE